MLGERLKLARKKAGLSQDRLVRIMGNAVTKQALSKYERGEMMPGSAVLTKLCKALGVSREYLLSDEIIALEAVDFRKRARTSAKERARVEATVVEQLERYLAIESVLELDSAKWQKPELKARKLRGVEDAESLADELRNEWNLGENPIPDMSALLEERGIKVLMLDLPGNVDGLTCFVSRRGSKAPVPVVVINKNKTLERRRLTLAHELFHRIGEVAAGVDEEKAAQRFAGAFLVPASHLRREAGEGRKSFGYRELIDLKRIYRTSAAALLVRLNQIGVIDNSTLSTAFQTVARTFRTDEPEEIEPEERRGEDERPERFDRLCYWALAEGYISRAKAMELLQKPLDEIEKAILGPAELNADHRK